MYNTQIFTPNLLGRGRLDVFWSDRRCQLCSAFFFPAHWAPYILGTWHLCGTVVGYKPFCWSPIQTSVPRLNAVGKAYEGNGGVWWVPAMNVLRKSARVLQSCRFFTRKTSQEKLNCQVGVVTCWCQWRSHHDTQRRWKLGGATCSGRNRTKLPCNSVSIGKICDFCYVEKTVTVPVLLCVQKHNATLKIHCQADSSLAYTITHIKSDYIVRAARFTATQA